MRKINSIGIILVAMGFCWGCKKDTVTNTVYYTVPSTYNFSNVNDSNQAKLLLMADQIGAAINLGNTSPSTIVSAQKLKDMFNNVNGYFTDSSYKLNGSGLKLSDYASATAKTDLNNYFDSIGIASQSTVAGKSGTAGVLASSASPTKKYLLSPNGIFYSQVVKKTFQHGVFGYSINRYLTDSVSNSVDNTTVVAGSGSAMQHNWDQAFGFFGVPINFPTVTTGSKYLASYSNQVDAGLGSNATIMNAFLIGRAAINNKDLSGKTTQANTIITTIELLNAASVVQEMKETEANIDLGDAVAAYGTLSESLGFVRGLNYNTSSQKVITSAQYTQLLALYDPINPNSPNLYNFVGAAVNTTAQIKAKTDAIRQLIGKIYGFTAAQLAAQ